MRKRRLPVYNYDWWSYPPEWDEQSRKLQLQWDEDIKASILISKRERTSPSIESIEAKKDGK